MAVKATRQMPVARKDRLLVTELESSNEILIYDLDYNKAFCLNQVAALVWKYCDGESSMSSAIETLNASLNLQVSEYVICYVLHQLNKHRLLEAPMTQLIIKGEVSRHALIRKQGITATVLLPAIISIDAPVGRQARPCESD
jgi:hypothetical protein